MGHPARTTAPASSTTDPGFASGKGCALHSAALAEGERFIDWKPEVCWQLPLRLEHHYDDNSHLVYTLREWKRRDWGEGGADLHWWCTDGPEAFVGHEPVYDGAARRDHRAGGRMALRCRWSSTWSGVEQRFRSPIPPSRATVEPPTG